MGIALRYNTTASILRLKQVSDGKGGIVDSAVTQYASIQFFKFKPKPFTMEAVITSLGLEVDAVLYQFESEDTNAYSILNNDIIKVSATEQYRVYSTEPIIGLNGQSHHWSGVGVLIRKTL